MEWLQKFPVQSDPLKTKSVPINTTSLYGLIFKQNPVQATMNLTIIPYSITLSVPKKGYSK